MHIIGILLVLLLGTACSHNRGGDPRNHMTNQTEGYEQPGSVPDTTGGSGSSTNATPDGMPTGTGDVDGTTGGVTPESAPVPPSNP